MKRRPIEDIYEFIINNNLKFIKWVDEYKNQTSKLECECLLHNKTFITTVNRLMFCNVRCKECMIQKVRKNKGLDENIVYEDFISRGYQIVEGKYENAYSSFVLRCPNNHLWTTDYHNFKHKGRDCLYCHYERNKGETANHWQGGITPLHNFLRNNINQWKLDSMKNSKYKCVITGNDFDVIHHLYNFNKILQEIIEETKLTLYNNISKYTPDELQLLVDKCLEIHYRYPLGVCLSIEIHKLFHNLYGVLDNTPEQFEEFKQRYLACEFDLKEVSSL